MVKKSYSPEQVINKLREAEILLNQGATVGEASRKIGVTEQTYYRWRREYGGMRVERIWRREGLKVPKKQPKRRRLWLNDGSCTRLHPSLIDSVI